MTLLVLHVICGALRQRSAIVRRLRDFAPCFGVWDGEMQLPRTPLGPQMSADELFSRLRQRGIFDLEGIRLVVIEPTGGVTALGEGEQAGQVIAAVERR